MPGWREQYKRKSEAFGRLFGLAGAPDAGLPADVASQFNTLTSGTMRLSLV